MQYTALPTHIVRSLQQEGGNDAYDNAPERAISDGDGNPCRHCLKDIPKGDAMLILAYRPFEDLHPYAETGPIFLCADACQNGSGDVLPEIMQSSPDYLVKGYCYRDRIVYGTGKVVAAAALPAYAKTVLDDGDVSYLHVRSARNNCYQLRIDRG
ncbi:DUF1203 domain-containing protein [Sulfitobacter noctilucicola]|uniref:DUF1203 domain-containing protein n=1 Tax=Sulfitobacter noctilucicola TaxID=1342301 RepID=A0A7W6M4W6_9RHOB|nr:hypothetical protein [Sulfitobacter noctilucicola]